MNRRDVEAFLRRDWALVAETKALYWMEQKRQLGPAEGVRVADELRRQALAARPDWPSEAERTADLETHIRVAESLRRASAYRNS